MIGNQHKKPLHAGIAKIGDFAKSPQKAAQIQNRNFL